MSVVAVVTAYFLLQLSGSLPIEGKVRIILVEQHFMEVSHLQETL